jgi:hypothetical protein
MVALPRFSYFLAFYLLSRSHAVLEGKKKCLMMGRSTTMFLKDFLYKLQMACGSIRDTTRIPTRALTVVLDRGGITKGCGPRDGEVKTEKGREPRAKTERVTDSIRFDLECTKNLRRYSNDAVDR